MSNLYAIGDIHGQYDMMIDVIKCSGINFNEDTVIFMGDYIDRGKKSYEVIEYLNRLKWKYPNNTIFLKGNHEDMFLRRKTDTVMLQIFLNNGGKDTIKSYKDHGIDFHDDFPEKHEIFLNSLKDCHITDDYIFVHAGLENKPIKEQDNETILWIRNKFINSTYDWGKMVVFGHTPANNPYVLNNKICIDTGAGYYEGLTCVKLPTPFVKDDVEFTTIDYYETLDKLEV